METLTVHTADELVTAWKARANRLAGFDFPYDQGKAEGYAQAAWELGCLLDAARAAKKDTPPSLRAHLVAMHVWEPEFVMAWSDADLAAQHDKAHDEAHANAARYISGLYRLPFPHHRESLEGVRP
jgi:hypothetical protein